MTGRSHRWLPLKTAMSGRALAAACSQLLARTVIPSTAIARRIAFVVLVDAIGTGMFLTGATLYLTRIVRLSVGQVGLGITIGALAGLLATIPLGILADRIGAGRLYVILQLWRGAWFIAYAFIGSFGVFVLVACCVQVADAAVPAIGTVVVAGAANDAERVETLAKVRAARNVGFGLGALLASLSITIGTRPAFLAIVLVNSASYFIAAALLVSAGVWSAGGKARRRAPVTLRTRPRYLLATVINAVLTVHMTILTIGLPLWIADDTTAPPGIIGLLVTLNTAMAALFQARFSCGTESISDALRTWARCGIALAAFGVVMAAIHVTHQPWLAICGAFTAVVLLTCAELWQATGAWKISYDLADPERRSQELSTFQLGVNMQSVAGPVVILDGVLHNSLGWPLLGAAALAAGLLARPLLRPPAETDTDTAEPTIA